MEEAKSIETPKPSLLENETAGIALWSASMTVEITWERFQLLRKYVKTISDENWNSRTTAMALGIYEGAKSYLRSRNWDGPEVDDFEEALRSRRLDEYGHGLHLQISDLDIYLLADGLKRGHSQNFDRIWHEVFQRLIQKARYDLESFGWHHTDPSSTQRFGSALERFEASRYDDLDNDDLGQDPAPVPPARSGFSGAVMLIVAVIALGGGIFAGTRIAKPGNTGAGKGAGTGMTLRCTPVAA